MLNIKDFKKWILPVLMFVFCEFIFRQRIMKNVFLVFNFFDSTIANRSFSFGMWNFIVACIVLLISKFVFKGKLTSIDSSEKMGVKKSVVTTLLFLILGIFLFYLMIYIVYYVFQTSFNSLNAKNVLMLKKQNEYIYTIMFISVDIFEEVVYRKLLFGYIYDLHSGCNKYIRFMTAALISSVIFGAIHDGVSNITIVYYAIGGMIFATSYFYTKRISVSIAVHILSNIYLQLVSRF